MDSFLKLKDGKTLQIKFTPRTMARFQAETRLTTGYFLGMFQRLNDQFQPVIRGDELTPEMQVNILSLLGFDDLKKMIYAGCLEVKSMAEADEILDQLEDGLFQNLPILVTAFGEFMNGSLIGKREPEETPVPLPKKKPEKPSKEAENPAE